MQLFNKFSASSWAYYTPLSIPALSLQKVLSAFHII
jgi:hypothetical protein